MNNNIAFDIKFTKFFPVKSPMGFLNVDSEKEKSFPDVGVDTYMPKMTDAFIQTLLKLNPTFYYHETTETVSVCNAAGVVLEFNSIGEYIIHQNVIIPSGIGVLIPNGYHIDYRAKSSNFNNGYTVITGLIDLAYTFGIGVQVIVTKDKLTLKEDQKIAQLVLQKTYLIGNMIEMSLDDWNKDETVIARKNERAGGFGHTGKF